MLNRELIQKFENELLDVAHEREILSDKQQEFKSVFDEDDMSAAQQSALSSIFESAFAEEGREEEYAAIEASAEEESPQESEEAISPIDETQESESLVSETDIDTIDQSISFEDTTEDISEEVLSEIDDEDVEDPIDDTEGDEILSQLEEKIEESEDFEEALSIEPENTEIPPAMTNTVAEEVEDNIDDIEQNTIAEMSEEATEEEISNTDFVLPQQYLSMTAFVPPSQSNTEQAKDSEVTDEDEIDNEDDDNIMGSAESILFGDTEEDDAGEDFSNEEIESMYDSEGEIYKGKETYKSHRDFDSQDEQDFIDKLDSFSIHLKNAIITIMTNEALGEEAERLTDLILDNAASTTIHRECEKILQQNIQLVNESKIYTDFSELKSEVITLSEAAKRTTKFLILRILPIAAAIAIVSFYGYLFAYRPLRAWSIYEKGYTLLEEKQYEESEEQFIKATNVWRFSSYFYKYANRYLEDKDYDNARIKYEQLIFGTNERIRTFVTKQVQQQEFFVSIEVKGKLYPILDITNFSKKAFITLADFEETTNQNYSIARAYYNYWLTQFSDDANIYAKLGNLYIAWYDSTENPWYLEQAGATFDRVVIANQQNDESLLLKTRWAVRANDEEYINDILGAILNNEYKVINDVVLTPYLEIAKYKLQQDKFIHMGELLRLIESYAPAELDLPYLFALYYEDTKQYDSLKNSLLQTEYTYNTSSNLTSSQYKNLIHAEILLAKLAIEYENNFLVARNHINQAQILFEKLVPNLKLEDTSSLAQLYFIRAQLELIRGNINASESYITKAVKGGYQSDALVYHQGVINYLNNDWADATERFVSLLSNRELSPQQKKVLLLATGNALFYHKNYIASSIYYKQLLELLKQQRGSSTINITTINLDYNVDTKIFFNKIAQVQNNLGAALYYAARKSINNEQLKQQAILEMQKSDFIFQQTSRDNLVRSTNKSISYTNLATIFDANYNFDIEIYSEIAYALNPSRFQNSQKLLASQ